MLELEVPRASGSRECLDCCRKGHSAHAVLTVPWSEALFLVVGQALTPPLLLFAPPGLSPEVGPEAAFPGGHWRVVAAGWWPVAGVFPALQSK